MKTPISFTINKSDLLAMRVLQSSDESRYVLCGVHFHITKTAITLISTDGRRMGILRAKEGVELPDGAKSASFTVNYPMVRHIAGR